MANEEKKSSQNYRVTSLEGGLDLTVFWNSHKVENRNHLPERFGDHKQDGRTRGLWGRRAHHLLALGSSGQQVAGGPGARRKGFGRGAASVSTDPLPWEPRPF